MPIFISNPVFGGTGLQALATATLFDFETTSDGSPLANAGIDIWLGYDKATVAPPGVVLESKRTTVFTDANGYWTLNVVPNLLITPAGTYYVVRTPQRTYRTAIPGGTGPFQASLNLAP